MKEFTEADKLAWYAMISKKVWKNPKTTSTSQPKPFKSKQKVNTVKGVVVHTQTGQLAFTFHEDESQVQCWRCSIAPTTTKEFE